MAEKDTAAAPKAAPKAAAPAKAAKVVRLRNPKSGKCVECIEAGSKGWGDKGYTEDVTGK